MSRALEQLSAVFAPPTYLQPAPVGFDLSTSGVKAVRLKKTAKGLVLERYVDVQLSPDSFIDGEVKNPANVAKALREAAEGIGGWTGHAALPEVKSYLFETKVPTEGGKEAWKIAVEQKLAELVPLSPTATEFDVVDVATKGAETTLVGVGFAKQGIEKLLAVYDEAGISVQSLESENFAMTRSVTNKNDEATILVVDIGKTSTKICIAEKGVPRFTTTIAFGGHALTEAIQKYFGATESEARTIKREKGIVPSPGNDEFLGVALPTLAAIRDEIVNRLSYWQLKATPESGRAKVTSGFIVGGNATVKGLQEYFQNALQIPVSSGDVFLKFASREDWVPPISRNESLAYATAIGLALRTTP